MPARTCTAPATTPEISDLRYDPGDRALGDFSGTFGVPQNQADGVTGSDQDCASDPAHNAWVLPAGWSGLSSGFYRLNVNTSVRDHSGGSDLRNFDVGAENMFSIWVGASSGNARVYGGGRMVAYTNLDAGNQSFYLAQIEGIHAGKTMVITLFDPGESSGNAFLRVLSPQGGTYHRATFDWTSDDGRSGDDVTQIQTSNGDALFDNKILTIRSPCPPTTARATSTRTASARTAGGTSSTRQAPPTTRRRGRSSSSATRSTSSCRDDFLTASGGGRSRVRQGASAGSGRTDGTLTRPRARRSP